MSLAENVSRPLSFTQIANRIHQSFLLILLPLALETSLTSMSPPSLKLRLSHDEMVVVMISYYKSPFTTPLAHFLARHVTSSCLLSFADSLTITSGRQYVLWLSHTAAGDNSGLFPSILTAWGLRKFHHRPVCLKGQIMDFMRHSVVCGGNRRGGQGDCPASSVN